MRLSGKRGKVTINSNDFSIGNWSANVESENLDSTTGNDGGFRAYVSGLVQGSGTFETTWDTSDPVTNKAPNIVKGTQYPIVLHMGNPGGSSIETDNLSGTMQLGSIEITNEVAGRVTVSVSFDFSGTITTPT